MECSLYCLSSMEGYSAHSADSFAKEFGNIPCSEAMQHLNLVVLPVFRFILVCELRCFVAIDYYTFSL